MHTNWQPIDTAPWERPILLKGNSGYVYPSETVVVMAYRARDYRQGIWLDMSNDAHSDQWPGEWTHWMEVPT